MEQKITEVRELIQANIMLYCDGMPEYIITELCQIVCDGFKEFKNA